MDSMVERVARAICDTRFWEGAWIKANEVEMNAFRFEARAAIEAMIEPNRRMLDAGVDADDKRTGYETVKHIHRAMITAALDARDAGQVAETAGALAPSVQE
jgi:hypothetical protein